MTSVNDKIQDRRRRTEINTSLEKKKKPHTGTHVYLTLKLLTWPNYSLKTELKIHTKIKIQLHEIDTQKSNKYPYDNSTNKERSPAFHIQIAHLVI